MVHKHGIRGEDYFEDFIKQNNIDIKRVHNPFDFIINGKYVEVKSAKLYVKENNSKTKFQHGRYECWNKKQMDKLKKHNVWVCFIIRHNKQCLIQGFAKSKDIPNKRKMTMFSIQHIPLKSIEQFLQYIRGNKNE